MSMSPKVITPQPGHVSTCPVRRGDDTACLCDLRAQLDALRRDRGRAQRILAAVHRVIDCVLRDASRAAQAMPVEQEVAWRNGLLKELCAVFPNRTRE